MKISKASLGLAIVGLGAIVALNVAATRGRAPATTTSIGGSETGGSSIVAAGPGRVEPLSEEVRIGAEIGGKLDRVAVEEGDAVRKGQVLAVLVNDDFRARVQSAEADLGVKEADERRVTNGAREQERQEAAASVRETEAVLESTQADNRRRHELYNEAVISREELDRADQDLGVARARLDAARQHHAFVDADAREEDAARAHADLELSRAKLAEARAMYAKTFIRSPIDGIVLRKHRRQGESVSTQFDSPIVTVADRSTVRVRVDIDETDVGKISIGQHAYVTADAFGDRRFGGRVVRVGQLLGKKNVRTDEPTERIDQKILETLIEIEDGHELPIGLRVQAFVIR
jgi:ABC exporter DevB family membrane fusion protein